MPDRFRPVPPSPSRLAASLALIYAAFASGWIVYSDQLLAVWFRDPEQITQAQTVKGLAFVCVSAVMLWWLARTGFSRQGAMREELLRHEHDWRTMFRDSPLPMWVCERAGGRVLAVNDAAARHYGYTRPELMAMRVADLERPPRRAAAAADASSGASPARRHYRRNGEAIEVEIHARDTEFGGVPATLMLIHDVSARARAERERAASEARLRIALHATGLGLWDHRLEEAHIETNDELARMLGHVPKTFVETPEAWLARLHPDDREAVAARFRAYLEGRVQEYRCEFRMMTADGEYRWFSSAGEIVEREAAGEPRRVMGTCLDITEQVEARRALEDSRRFLQQVIDSSPDWIFVKDAQHRFLMVNRAFAQAQGLAPDDMHGRPDTDFWPPEECEGDPATGRRGFHDDDRDALAGRIVSNPADVASDAGGHRRLFETVKAPLFDADGRIRGVLGYAHHVTERAEVLARLSALAERLVVAADATECGALARELRDAVAQLSVAGHAPAARAQDADAAR